MEILDTKVEAEDKTPANTKEIKPQGISKQLKNVAAVAENGIQEKNVLQRIPSVS